MADCRVLESDTLYAALAQHNQTMASFLDSMFSWLDRCTDFYDILTPEKPDRGFAPGAAKELVLTSYNKYLKKHQERNNFKTEVATSHSSEAFSQSNPSSTSHSSAKSCEQNLNTRSLSLAILSLPPDFPEESAHVEKLISSLIKETISLKNVKFHAADAPYRVTFAIDSPAHAKTMIEKQPFATTELPSELWSDSLIKCQIVEVSEQHEKSKSVSATTSLHSAHVTSGRISTWNGAALDQYFWNQSIREVNVEFLLPKKCSCKDLKIKMTSNTLSIKLRDQIILDGTLDGPINKSESTWTLEDGHKLLFTLEKRSENWWKCVVKGDPEIDPTKVESVKHVSEFDDQTQSHIRKILFDQSQKAQGLPTSDEMHKLGALKAAWNAEGSPFKNQPFDPSILSTQSDFSDTIFKPSTN